MKGNRKIDFFIIGKPKSGTTSLYNLLKQHSRIFLSDPKEPNFWCKDFHEEADRFHGTKRSDLKKKFFAFRTFKEYFELYTDANNDQLLGDLSTHYLYSKVAADQIYTHNPLAKIIMVFRDPLAFLRSQHGEFVASLAETEKDFDKAIDLEPVRRNGKKIPSLTLTPSFLQYTKRIHYAEEIKRYLTLFPKENIKIYLQDELHKDTLGVIEDILEFIGLDNTELPQEFKRHNKHQELRLRWLKRIVEQPNYTFWVKVRKILPRWFFASAKKFYYDFTLREEKRKPLSLDSVRKYKKAFQKDVIAFNTLLHKENLIDSAIDVVTLWGYDDESLSKI